MTCSENRCRVTLGQLTFFGFVCDSCLDARFALWKAPLAVVSTSQRSIWFIP